MPTTPDKDPEPSFQDQALSALGPAKRKQEQRRDKADRATIGKPVFRDKKIDVKNETGREGEFTTAALESWSAANYLDYFLQKMNERQLAFKTSGDRKRHLHHMRIFLDRMNLQEIAPRSITKFLEHVINAFDNLAAKYKLSGPSNCLWILNSKFDDLAQEFGHILYTRDSLNYVLLENVSIEAKVTAINEGWLIEFKFDAGIKNIRILRGEESRVLNPNVKKLMRQDNHSFESEQQSQDDLPNFG